MSIFQYLELIQPDLFGFSGWPRNSRPPVLAARPRHIQLEHQIVTYTLRQGQRRRRISLRIDERGLSVGAPGRTSLASIEAFIQSHATWVLLKLTEYENQQAERQLSIQDGVRLPLLGGMLTLRIMPSAAGRNRSCWHDDYLHLEVREGTEATEYAVLVRRALQARAMTLFSERLVYYARAMGRTPPPLRLSSARTRWGSCSLNSGIRINWRLIHLPLSLIDYVIVHELAHLVEMNHSPQFWTVVAQVYPAWAEARNELRIRGREMPVW